MEPYVTDQPLFPVSVDLYHRMLQHGVLSADDPVELLEEVLVYRPPAQPRHAYAVDALQQQLRELLPSGECARLKSPITLSDGEPEPDLCAAAGNYREFVAAHPTPGIIRFVVEVSDTTLARDRGIKLRSYARAGIGEYWIVNLESRCVEVYTHPDATAAEPTYRERVDYDAAASVPVTLGGVRIGQVSVAAILP